MPGELSAGVIGLGIIGSRVAVRLADAGIPLAVWNRTPRRLPGLPEPVADPAAVAAVSTVIQIFVTDDAALRETLEAMAPALDARHVVLCHATVSPESVRNAAALAARKGFSFLDAPFTGSRDAAAQGQLAYYIGGAPEVLERVRPVLEVSAKSILRLGEIGTASAVKIATNIMAASAAAALADAVNFLRTNNVDPAVLTAALENNAARSGITDLKLPCMLTDDFAPRFSAKNMRKDMRLAKHLSEEGRAALTATVTGLYEQACSEGYGDEDFSAVVKVRMP